MRKRLTSPTTIGGFGTIVVTIVIFFAQGGFEDMNSYTPLYIIGLVVGIGMIIYGFVKQPKTESQSIIRDRINQRRMYLPQLRDIIDNIIARKKKLMLEASNTKLGVYYNLYIKNHNRRYRLYRKTLSENQAIITTLLGLKFSSQNLYLKKLEETDQKFIELNSEYDKYYTMNKDNILRKYLKQLWKQTYRTFSLKSMISIFRDKYEIKAKYISRLYQVEPLEDERLRKATAQVKSRIAILLTEGIPDE